MTSLNLLTGFLLLTSIGLQTHKQTHNQLLEPTLQKMKTKKWKASNPIRAQITGSCLPGNPSSLPWDLGAQPATHSRAPSANPQTSHLQAAVLSPPPPPPRPGTNPQERWRESNFKNPVSYKS